MTVIFESAMYGPGYQDNWPYNEACVRQWKDKLKPLSFLFFMKRFFFFFFFSFFGLFNHYTYFNHYMNLLIFFCYTFHGILVSF